MPLPRILLRLFDPAGAEFERDRSSRPQGPLHHRAVVFGPGEPDGGRPATAEEAAELEAGAAGHTARFDASVEDLLRRRSAELEAAVDELLRTGSVELRLGAWNVEARILRFWHGDSMLEISSEAGTATRHSRTRIPRDPARLGRDVLAFYLANEAADD